MKAKPTYALFIGIFLLTVMYFAIPETPYEKELRFLECSENEGDAGCDSCYYLVYGKHIDPYTGEEIK